MDDFHRRWDQLISTFGSEERTFVIGTFLVHEAVFISFNLILAVLYHFEWPFFEKYRIVKNKFPPRELIWECLKWGLINQVLIIPSSVLTFRLFKAQGMEFSGPLPDLLTVVWQVFINMLIEDFMFYWSHRFLHWNKIYRHIHKMHHKFNYTIGIASEYAHPAEFILGNVIPLLSGSLIQGVHLFTFWIWISIRIFETVDGHSGYEFPWSPFHCIPFAGGSRKHDYHHSKNKGNFGSFFNFWDDLFGTNLDYKSFLDNKQQQEKDE